MYEKKQVVHESPNLDKMKQVIINHKTRIYIGIDEDPEEAKKRYFEKMAERKA